MKFRWVHPHEVSHPRSGCGSLPPNLVCHHISQHSKCGVKFFISSNIWNSIRNGTILLRSLAKVDEDPQAFCNTPTLWPRCYRRMEISRTSKQASLVIQL